jgi:hypothetical protein
MILFIVSLVVGGWIWTYREVSRCDSGLLPDFLSSILHDHEVQREIYSRTCVNTGLKEESRGVRFSATVTCSRRSPCLDPRYSCLSVTSIVVVPHTWFFCAPQSIVFRPQSYVESRAVGQGWSWPDSSVNRLALTTNLHRLSPYHSPTHHAHPFLLSWNRRM